MPLGVPIHAQQTTNVVSGFGGLNKKMMKGRSTAGTVGGTALSAEIAGELARVFHGSRHGEAHQIDPLVLLKIQPDIEPLGPAVIRQ